MDKGMILPIAALALLAANVVSFSLMAHDKRMARSGGRRVPEKTLFLASACFGGLGGVLGMQLMRHKTKHWYFRAFFPILLAVQAILLLAGLYLLRRVP